MTKTPFFEGCRTKQDTVELTNVGPIHGSFSIDLDGPGLYELQGGKGTGKSTVLSALSLISGHKVSLTVHDGELSGQVKGFGVVAPVGSRKRKKGELELETIDTTRCDLGDLIDPDGKTAETRDAARIKALAALSGLELRPKDFYDLVGGKDNFTGLGVNSSDDAVTMCSRVKSAIETEARRLESIADTEIGHAKAHAERAEGVDVTHDCDPSSLATAAETAARELTVLKDRREQRITADAARKEALAALNEASANYQGPTVGEAQQTFDEWTAMVDDLRQKLKEAESSLKVAGAELRAAKEHDATTELWRKTLDTELPVSVTDEELATAEKALQDARASQERGMKIREAIEAARIAARHSKAAKDATKRAKQLRRVAQGVWNILTTKLQTHELTIESVDGAPRLVVDHIARGKTVYDVENGLSDGERVRVAIDEMLPRLKSPGLLPLPQRIWQDLPPSDRADIARYAAEKGLFVFSAQVTDGELRVQRYEP